MMADVGDQNIRGLGLEGGFWVRRGEPGLVGEIQSPVSGLPEVSHLSPHPKTTDW